MTPAQAREQLAIDLLLTADWRRRRACQCPDDRRDADAAALLDKLAVSVNQIDDEMIDCCVSLWGDAREWELWSEMRREIGFHRWPANAAELVAEFITVASGPADRDEVVKARERAFTSTREKFAKFSAGRTPRCFRGPVRS